VALNVGNYVYICNFPRHNITYGLELLFKKVVLKTVLKIYKLCAQCAMCTVRYVPRTAAP